MKDKTTKMMERTVRILETEMLGNKNQRGKTRPSYQLTS